MPQALTPEQIDDASEREHFRRLAADYIRVGIAADAEKLTEALMLAHFRGQQFALHRGSVAITDLMLSIRAIGACADSMLRRKGDTINAEN